MQFSNFKMPDARNLVPLREPWACGENILGRGGNRPGSSDL